MSGDWLPPQGPSWSLIHWELKPKDPAADPRLDPTEAQALENKPGGRILLYGTTLVQALPITSPLSVLTLSRYLPFPWDQASVVRVSPG